MNEPNSDTKELVKTILNINKFYLPSDLDYSTDSRIAATSELACKLNSIVKNDYENTSIEIDYEDAFRLLYEIAFLNLTAKNARSIANVLMEKLKIAKNDKKKWAIRYEKLQKKYEDLESFHEQLLQSTDKPPAQQDVSSIDEDQANALSKTIDEVFLKATKTSEHFHPESFSINYSYNNTTQTTNNVDIQEPF